jgi:hypothetical protein
MTYHPLKAWNRFWFAPVSAKPLGAFRIAFGCLSIFNLLLLTVDFDYWLSDLGMIKGKESLDIAGWLRPSILNHLHDPTSVRIVFGVTLAAAVGLTVGWRTRLVTVIHYLGMLMIHHRNIVTSSGADSLVMLVSFYLILCPSGAAYSLDARREARRRGGTAADPLISPWGQRLIQIQISGLYFVTAILKAHGASWLNGTALHYVLINREIGRFDLSFLAGYPILVNIMTFGAIAIELSLGMLLWFKAARPWVILAGISLHFGILFMVNIPIFGELCMAAYMLFLTSGEWEALAKRCDFAGRAAWVLQALRWKGSRAPVRGSFASTKQAVTHQARSV